MLPLSRLVTLMVKTNLDEIIYLKSALKCKSFDRTIGIKFLFFRVLVTIEPGHSLLQFFTTNCLKGNRGHPVLSLQQHS